MAEASAAAVTERRNRPGPLRANRAFGLSIALVVLLLDHSVKWMVINVVHLPERLTLKLLPIFQLDWVRNDGVSLNYLRAHGEVQRWLLVGFTAAIALFVLAWLWREQRRPEVAALALILGGALGNILDRVRLGYVVDYADLHFGAWSPFLVFNLADAAITIGVLLLLVRALLTRERKAPREKV